MVLESQRRTVSQGIIEQSIGSSATQVDLMNKLEVSRLIRNNNGSSGNYQIQTTVLISYKSYNIMRKTQSLLFFSVFFLMKID